MKSKGIFILFTVILLMFGCMSITAFAEDIIVTAESKEWSTAGTYVVNEDVTINGTVTVTADVTLNIAGGKTLTITGTEGAGDVLNGKAGLMITSGTLTVSGTGTLNATGGSGLGITGKNNSTSGAGGAGISITGSASMVVIGGSVETIGGNGGDCSNADNKSYTGNGGDGISIGESASMAVSSGQVSATGGNGGNLKADENCYAGDAGNGISIGKSLSIAVSGGTLSATGGNGGDLDNDNCIGCASGRTGHGISIGEGASMVVSAGQVSAGVSKEDIGFIYGRGIIGGSITIQGGEVQAYSNASNRTDSISTKVTMTDGKLKLGSKRNFFSGSCFSGGIMNFEVSSQYLGFGCKCVKNTDSETTEAYPYKVEAPPTYAITCGITEENKETNHGYITVSMESAAEDQEVTITAYPVEGYGLARLTYTVDGGTAVDITRAMKFTMPGKAVSIQAEFGWVYTLTNGTPQTAASDNNGYITLSAADALEGEEITVTSTPAEGYELKSLTYTPEGGEAVDITSEKKFDMPAKNVTVQAEFTPSGKALKAAVDGLLDGSASGGVVFSVDGREVTQVVTGTTVTITVTSVKGYTVTVVVRDAANQEVALTPVDGSDNTYTFTMPDSEVSVSLTYTPISSGEETLDLEENDSTCSNSAGIGQYYRKTTGTGTVSNYKVQVSWTAADLEIEIADCKRWDPVSLAWNDDSENADNGTASVKDGTNVRTFTFINYSPEALKCNVSFASELTGKYTDYSVDKTDAQLDAVTEGENHTTNSSYVTDDKIDPKKLPSTTVTCTVNPDLSGFKDAAASESAKYGTYTITINRNN